MSLICFRGHQILPPLIDGDDTQYIESKIHNGKTKTCETTNVVNSCEHNCRTCQIYEFTKLEEDNTILSLPPCEALSFILTGLDKKTAKFNLAKSICKRYNLTLGCQATRNGSGLGKEKVENENTLDPICKSLKLTSKLNKPTMSLKSKPRPISSSSVHAQNINVNLGIEESSTSEVGETTLSLSYTSSPFSEDDVQRGTEFELEQDHYTDNDSRSTNRSEHILEASLSSSLTEPTKSSNLSINQKIGALKCLGRDSSTYLEDYLQLLTSRVPPTCRQKLNSSDLITHDNRDAMSLDASKKGIGKNHRRKVKNSNQSISRSLGSNYLDNYLVNLTDYSWIIYPTESKTSALSSKSVTFDLASSSTDDSSTKKQVVTTGPNDDSSYLRRKLHFIDPEKFFNRNLEDNKSSFCEKISLPNDINSEDKAQESKISNVIDSCSATSPDISSSIFDQDNDDSCQTSIELSESIKSKDLISNKDNCDSLIFENTITDEMSQLTNSDKLSISEKSTSGVISMSTIGEINCTVLDSKEEKDYNCMAPLSETEIKQDKHLKTLNSESTKDYSGGTTSTQLKSKLIPSFHVGDKIRSEGNAEDESSSSSEVSSATEPSTIVMAGDNQSLAPSDFEQLSLSSEIGRPTQDDKVIVYPEEFFKNVGEILNVELNTIDSNLVGSQHQLSEEEEKNGNVFNKFDTLNDDRPSSSISVLTQDDSLISESTGCGKEQKLSFLIDMLKVKQQKEKSELERRHEFELQHLLSQLQQLPDSQVSILASAYSSPNNNSLHELFEFTNISAQNSFISMTNSMTTTSDLLKEHTSSLSSPNEAVPNVPASNHTSSMQSFFLHENRSENGINGESDNSQISQIFSSSRAKLQHIPQTISELLVEHPNLGSNAVQTDGEICTNLDDPRMLTRKNHQLNCEQMEVFSKSTLEAGLDLVPARESDLATIYDKMLNSKHINGICKLQAVIRGRISRKMMRTSQVQKLLATLKEVAILAHRFHHDILTDNIQKGDVDFHKALFNEEQQARDKLNHLMVGLSPADQVKLIEKDRITKEKESQRKFISPSKIIQPSFSKCVASKVKSGLPPNINFSSRSLIPNSHKSRMVKQIPTRMSSEPPRPCQASQSSEESVRKHSLSPRSRCISSIPTPKPHVALKNIPKIRTCTLKKSEIKLPGTMTKSLNAHLCKTESVLNSYGTSRLNGNHRSPVRGDVFHVRKPWR